ncbi:hypothetical protein FNV43_RR04474 [Rhamnella rubrinervis]|uniref:peptidylprolyl isomerase n=1 Tax=Rhamnella rubrinervis TaxID=2594499 RepID=A0A8K0HKT2_9ROSA|nr:hypothetical protein FNV43_RR04474 [Rhamnella rubrinervis]
MVMELCIGSSSSATVLFNQHSSRTFLCLVRTISVLSRTIYSNSKEPSFRFSSLGLPFFQQTPSRSRRCSSPFVASASSSSVAADGEIDQLPASIEVTETQQPNSRVKLTVEVPSAICDDCYSRILKEFMKQSKVPGFRPGKQVPESILVNYVGKKNVQKATVESILKRTLPHAMSSVTGRALRDSVQIVTKFSDMEQAYSSLNSLSYDVIVDVAPEVKWIKENGYKNLKIVVEIDTDIGAQKASEKELRRRHKSLGSLKIVTDRGLQVGDVAVLDISATTIDQVESNVQKIPSAESKGFHFDTEDGDKFLPGFLDKLVGIQRGETKPFPLVFPETWTQENLRGVHAEFTVECKELFFRDLPELDDSLADRLLPGCTTLEQVTTSLSQGIIIAKCLEVEQTAKEQATDSAILDQLCKVVLHSEMVEIDIPQSLFEEQGRQLYGAKLLQIQANMKLNDQQLASLSSQKAVYEYLENQRENITNVIKQNLAVGDIFKRENLQVSTAELIKEVGNSISEFKRQNQEYDEDRVREQVQEILEGAKVLEWLREHSEIQYITR